MSQRKSILRTLFFLFLLTCLLTGLAGTVRVPVNAAPNFAPSTTVVISQVYGGGGNVGATYTHDFVELFNLSGSSVDLSTWSIQYAAATGTSWSVASLTGSILPGQYYLVQLAAGAGGTTSLPTPDVTGNIAMAATAGKVALVNSITPLTGSGCPFDASVIDFVGYGTTADCREGGGTTTSNAPAPSNTTADIRVSSGCTDTDNNNGDFVESAPNPRNTSSIGLICGVGTYTPTITPIPVIDVLINEVAWAGTRASSDDEWIELYNPGGTDINIGGWRLVAQDGSPDIIFPSGTIIASGGFYLLERREEVTSAPHDLLYSGALDDTGEILRLRKPDGTIVDTANSNGGAWPTVSAAPNYPSMERTIIAPDSDFTWVTFSGPTNPAVTDAGGNLIFGTPGSANSQLNVAPTLTLTPTLTSTSTATSTATPSITPTRTNTPTITSTALTPATNIVISEFRTVGPSGGNDEFIELYNPTSSPILIGGWSLRRSTGCGATTALITTIPAGVTLAAGQHYLIGGSSYSGPVSADLSANIGVANDGGIALLHSSGAIIDQVGLCFSTVYKEGTTLVPLTTNTNRSYDRKSSPSGVCGDSNNNAQDFFLRLPSDPQNSSSSLKRCGNPTPTPTVTPPRTPTPFRTPTLPPPPPLIAINEFVPRPGTDWNNDGVVNTGDEYIELINHGAVSVNLSGYTLDDEVNIGSTPYRLPSRVLQPGERIVYYGSQTGLLLGDGGDGVRLLKPNGQLADAYNYSVVRFPDQSYCRLPDNGGLDDWNQNCRPTPGLPNQPAGSSLPPSGGAGNEALCPISDTLPADFALAECPSFGNIWSRWYWDQDGWFGEMFIPNLDTQWEVFVD